MRVLTFEEFKNRTIEVAKARRIFIESGFTNNITLAFEIYQEILGEETYDLFITNRQKPFNNITRPLCSECDTELKLDMVPRKINNKLYLSTWVCINCGAEFYSQKSPREWYEELK